MERQAAPAPPDSTGTSGTSESKELYPASEGTRRFALIGVSVTVLVALTFSVALWTVAQGSRRLFTNETVMGRTWNTNATSTELTSSGLRPGAAAEAPPSSTAVTVCNTQDCQYTRRLLEKSVDKTKDPCQNFHTFVCNGLDASERTDSGMLTAASLNLVTEMVGDLMTESVPPSGQTAFQKAAAMYEHCRRGSTDPGNRVALVAFLKEYGLTREENPNFDPLDTLVQFIFKIDIPVLFGVDVIILDQTPPYPFMFNVRKEFLWRKSNRSKSLHVEVDRVSSVLVTAGLWYDRRDVDKSLVEAVLNAEEKIINASDIDDDETKTYATPLSHFGYLQQDSVLGAKWLESLERHFYKRYRTEVQVHYESWVPSFFRSIFGNESSISNSELQRYFLWSTAAFFVNASHMEESSISLFYSCLQDVTNLFPFAAAFNTLFTTVNQSRMDAATAMTDRIIAEIVSSFNHCSWMDDATRGKALGKISLLRRYEGYPFNLSTPSAVDAYYKDYPDFTGPFVTDIIAAGRISTSRGFELFLTATEEMIRSFIAAHIFEPYDYSAAYAGRYNFIAIPPAVMLRPTFIYGGPPEINYGALGRVVVHELMHGFDAENRFLDGFGREVNWWSAESDAAFRDRVLCYNASIETAPKARRLEEYPGEYLADTMGGESLLRAYRKAAAESAVTLGDVKGLTRDQLFYVSWCYLWCGNVVPDPTHPPLDERCNVPLRNDAHFSEAFSCPLESPMNPEVKCNFW